jgi:ribosomal-protein-alanine N-acetyltransferase
MTPPLFNDSAFDLFPILQTPRLTLREIQPSDASQFFALRSNPKVRAYTGRVPCTEVAEVEIWMNQIKDGFANKEALLWVLEETSTGLVIGDVCFWRFLKQHLRAELGYELSPAYWGKGYMSEALKAVLRFGFEQLHVHSIEANVTPANKASIDILLRNGFKQEGMFKENYFGILPYRETETETEKKKKFPEGFMDTASFSLLDRDFKG